MKNELKGTIESNITDSGLKDEQGRIRDIRDEFKFKENVLRNDKTLVAIPTIMNIHNIDTPLGFEDKNGIYDIDGFDYGILYPSFIISKVKSYPAYYKYIKRVRNRHKLYAKLHKLGR